MWVNLQVIQLLHCPQSKNIYIKKIKEWIKGYFSFFFPYALFELRAN